MPPSLQPLHPGFAGEVASPAMHRVRSCDEAASEQVTEVA